MWNVSFKVKGWPLDLAEKNTHCKYPQEEATWSYVSLFSVNKLRNKSVWTEFQFRIEPQWAIKKKEQIIEKCVQKSNWHVIV